MAISRPDGSGDIANLGMTLSEAKQLLLQAQRQVVAEQTDAQAMFRLDCRSCWRDRPRKDWRPHWIPTLFGERTCLLIARELVGATSITTFSRIVGSGWEGEHPTGSPF
jgi:hypothetical protein